MMPTRACRLPGRLLCFALWVAGCFATYAVAADGNVSSPQTTLVQDTVFRADGTPATGWMVITWPAFVTADGSAVAAGTTSIKLGSGGNFSVPLAPNAGSQPAGTFYSVTLKLDNGVTSKEAWLVPPTSPATLAAVRAAEVPSTMAIQALTSDWANANLVNLTSMQSITGVKKFVAPPSAPDPVNATDVANKEYVDANAGGGPNVARVNVANTWTQSQTFSVPPSVPAPAQSSDVANKGYVDASAGASTSAANTWTNANSATQPWTWNLSNGVNGINALFNQQQTGFSTLQPLTITQDAYRGGINQFPGGLGTKTQQSGIRGFGYQRTVGERKWLTLSQNCYAPSDCISIFSSQHDWGGYYSGGDEGSEFVRGSVMQGDNNTSDFPQGTVASINGNVVTGSWTNGSNAWLGEQRPLIITSRGTDSTGTVAGMSYTGGNCVVTGSGTDWATQFGTGAVNQVFLNIPANNNGSMMLVWPITSISSNTSMVIGYTLNETGSQCPSIALATTGSYTIYQGAYVQTLSDPPSGQSNAIAVTVPAGGVFQAGDTIQQPVSYNFNPIGLSVVLGRLVGEPQGVGLIVNNQNPAPIESLARLWGNAKYGIRFNGTVSTGIVNSAFTSAFLSLTSTTASVHNLITAQNSGGTVRYFQYYPPGDYFSLAGFNISGDGARVATATVSPQANQAFYQYISPANSPTYAGRSVNYAANPNANVWLDSISATGLVWGIRATGAGGANAILNNGNSFMGYSGNLSGQTFSLNAATGAGAFVHLNQTGGHDIAGTIAISSATSGSASFATAFNSAPVCTLTPTSDPSSVGTWWVTTTTSAITANVKTAGTIMFNYVCAGNPN